MNLNFSSIDCPSAFNFPSTTKQSPHLNNPRLSYPFSSDTNRIANDAEVAHATAKAESAVPSYSAKIKKRKSKKNQQSNPIPLPPPK